MNRRDRIDGRLQAGFTLIEMMIVVVIIVPLVVAVMVTLWTLEQARQRKRQNREAPEPGAVPVKRRVSRWRGGIRPSR